MVGTQGTHDTDRTLLSLVYNEVEELYRLVDVLSTKVREEITQEWMGGRRGSQALESALGRLTTIKVLAHRVADLWAEEVDPVPREWLVRRDLLLQRVAGAIEAIEVSQEEGAREKTRRSLGAARAMAAAIRRFLRDDGVLTTKDPVV